MDKVVHSAVGLGCYLVASLLTVFVVFNLLPNWALIFWLSALFFGTGKETIDYIRYRKFDIEDLKATLNPLIVIKWYLKQIK